MAVSMVGPPKTDCPRVREKVIWESLYPILGSIRPHGLVTEKFGVKKLPLVTGWSMGGLQTFHWGALFPDMVERIAPFCGSAKCSRHNFVFLEGVKAALTADGARSMAGGTRI